MNRRSFLTSAALTTTALALHGCNESNRVAIDHTKHPQKQDEKLSTININRAVTKTLKIATSWPAHFPIMGTGVDRFASRIEQISAKSLQIKIFAKNTLVPALGVFDATSSGKLDGFHSGPYYWKGKNSAFSLFSGFPFGLTAQELNGWLMFGGGMQLWRELYAKHNLYPFAGGNTNIQMGGWFKKPIKSLKDIEGLKMRIPGLGGEVMAKLGANPILLPAGEIYTSLERGVIDATEWVGPALDTMMGFYKVAPYYYSGWHEPGSVLEMTFNHTTWSSLAQEHQAMIESAIAEMNANMIVEFQAKNTQALQKLDSLGVKLQQFPQSVIDAAKAATLDVLSEQSDLNPDFKRVNQSATEYLKQSIAWSDVSLKEYLNIR